jgi:uncharacterized phage protein (TIGR01671 family)
VREIEFRGKRIDNGEWVYGYFVKALDGTCYIITEFGADVTCCSDCGANAITLFEVIPETVGQHIRLPDKNSKKIYEGDTVRCIYDGVETVHIVVFDKSELDFKATNGKEEYGNHFQYMTCCEEVEVIGNIHDNLKRLKGVE